MKRTEDSALKRYIASGSKQVSGWLARPDAEIFRALFVGQSEEGLTGSAVEIGVHHGKSFIAMCLGLKGDEKAYCIDVFENQYLNKDNSGSGDREIFESNLAKYEINTRKITIDARSSEVIKPGDILDVAGAARFFSIDGGHWLEIVQNDLHLAEACLASHGVIALDDFHRPEWPDVSAGYLAWYQNRSKEIVPFAIGFNKLYLCEQRWSDFYQALLEKDEFITSFHVKNVKFQGFDVPVFSQFIGGEQITLKRSITTYLRLFRPELYFRVKNFKKGLTDRKDQ